MPSSPATPASAVLDAATFEHIRQLVHQQSGISLKGDKMNLVTARLTRRLRDLGIPEEALRDDQDPPYLRPAEDSPEHRYLMARRTALDGSLPRRTTEVKRPLTLPAEDPFVELAAGSPSMTGHRDRLTAELLLLDRPDAVPLALATTTAGQAFDRIADHASVMGARLRYLLTGDPDHLVAEVR